MNYYFAYGSNMDSARMKFREVNFSNQIKGFLKGYELVFNKVASGKSGIGYANLKANPKSGVEGIVYETDESLDNLDKHEGVSGGHYQRERVKVETKEGVLSCVTYISKMTGDALKPTREYLSHLLTAKPFLSKEYFSKIKNTITYD